MTGRDAKLRECDGVKALSLFSGVGGMDLGFQRAGIDTILQAENDPWCLAVLERHWPEVTRVDDVRKVDQAALQGRCGDAERLGAAGGRGIAASGADHRADGVSHERVRSTGGRPGAAASSVGREVVESGRGNIDLVYGGFPCTDVSVAGKRAGLFGERSGLWSEFRRVLWELRPRWCVIENVPGLTSICSCAACRLVLCWAAEHLAERTARGRAGACGCPECRAGQELRASHSGRDLANILADLEELGYGWAYRVLDARFFGVPQRRRRVFLVGCLGDAARAAQVLAVCESCGGHPAPRREAPEDVAYALNASVRGTGDGHGNAWNSNYVADERSVTAFDWQASAGNDESWQGKGRQHVVRSGDYAGAVSATRVDAVFGSDVAATLSAGGHPGSNMPGRHKEDDENLVIGSQVDAGAARPRDKRASGYRMDMETETFVVAQTLSSSYGKTTASGGSHGSQAPVNVVQEASGVRRLTPLECERLMGWPDGHTRYTADGTEISDSHRYRMCGNGVVATVAEWLGHRLVRCA